MTGAIALAGLAAARSGAGLVRLAVPDRCLETVASYSPCLMTIPLPDDSRGRIALEAAGDIVSQAQWATCVAIGPGLGQSRDLQQLMQKVLRTVRCPIVIDADGLNNLSHLPHWPCQRQGPVILTPHPGEWSRLGGGEATQRRTQCQSAVAFAAQHSKMHPLVIALKGHRTLATDGATSTENTTGTPAMATGGSGDCLTGIIAALICQGLAPLAAAQLAVYVHGLAGQIAQEDLGGHVVLPTDLVDALPAAFEQHRQQTN